MSNIDYHPDALLGSVTTPSGYVPSDFPLGSAVLCRNNAPLLGFAFSLLKRNLPCCILGRDLGEVLTKTIKSLKPATCQDLQKSIPEWLGRKSRKVKTRAQRAALEDRAQCLLTLARSCQSVDEIFVKIEKLFVAEAGPSCVTLSTMHKAKGLEWEVVAILDRKLCPSPWAESYAERIQERNLLFVAVTRTKLHLRYISSNCWKL
jgi:superfamily I DNA/RNA helicase